KGTGQADQRDKLHHGFGVHVGFLGHDLHGLRFGPDGKLYFSIGDRGTNVKDAEKPVFLPDMGCVMRCNPDGTELEVYAQGLRNPQELAFDECGNLFTCDNNSDAGDKARCVYVVRNGDSGVRSFAFKPKGATFQAVDEHQFIWSVLATDVDFGTDSAVYVSDWVEGWDKPNKGRIWKVSYPAAAKEPAVQEVKTILADGF